VLEPAGTLAEFLTFYTYLTGYSFSLLQFPMHLLATGKYPFLAAQTLTERQTRESLFRIGEHRFLLHMTSGEDFEEERLIWLDSRTALLWISQSADEYGMNWE